MSIRTILLAAASVVCMAALGQKSITAQECWLDGNFAARQPATATVDISGLAVGLHSYSVRVQDSEGLWSSAVTKYFVIPSSVQPATSITACEYWLDGDISTRATIGASPAQIDITDLTIGLHTFSIRTQDNNGVWSSPITKYFIKEAVVEPTTIARYMYWFDDDETTRVTGELTEASGVLPITLPGTLTGGTHTLSWRVGDSKGVWSNVRTESFVLEDPEPSGPQQDEDGYYLLGSAQDLNYFAELVNSGSVNINARMTADIDLEGSEANQWTPIGNSTYKYNGVFDGQGHVVKNLYYKYAGIAGVGFIGVGSSGAYIKNLRVEGYVDNSSGSGTGSGEAQTCAGGIMGASEEATIINCSFSGSVISYSGVAGIVGCNTALIINCYNEGEVIFHATSGQGGSGIHGTYDGYHHQQVINSYNVGSVINKGYSTSYMGSISCSGTISNCYSRENCCQNGNGASWTNTGNYGTAMSLSDMKTEDFVATLNGNVAALKSTYPDISEWVLDPITNLPIQAIFANAEPEVPTVIEEANTQQPTANSQKLIRDGRILILRGGRTYTLTGQQIR